MNVREALARLAPAELRGLAESLGLDGSSPPARLPNLVAAHLRSNPSARRAVLGFLQAHGTSAAGPAPEPSADQRVEEQGAVVAAEPKPSGSDRVVRELRERVAKLEASLSTARREAAAAGATAAEERARSRELALSLEAAERKIRALVASLEATPPPATVSMESSAAARRVEALEAELERLQAQRPRREARLADDARQLEGRREELTRAVGALERRHADLRTQVPEGAAAMGRFVRGFRGGAVVAPGREALLVSDAERVRLGLVDGMQVVITHGGAPAGRIRPCDERPLRELFGEIETDDEGQSVLATAWGPVPLVGGGTEAGCLVKAVTLDGGDPPASAEVERVLSSAEVRQLLGEGPGGPRRRRRRRGGSGGEERARPPETGGISRVLIVGGDRVGTAYVDELARRGVASEWTSGFGGLVARSRGFGGARLVVLVLSQASHTLARAVTEAAEASGIRVVRTTARGVAAVADLVQRSLGGDSDDGSKEGA